jgi:hypothetical protein
VIGLVVARQFGRGRASVLIAAARLANAMGTIAGADRDGMHLAAMTYGSRSRRKLAISRFAYELQHRLGHGRIKTEMDLK